MREGGRGTRDSNDNAYQGNDFGVIVRGRGGGEQATDGLVHVHVEQQSAGHVPHHRAYAHQHVGTDPRWPLHTHTHAHTRT
jgi:hypothetical protein